MKVESLDRTPYLRALFYGDSGSGKTTLLGSAMECPETTPLLVLNAGGQPISYRRYDPRPLVLTVEALRDLNPIYKWFELGQPRNRTKDATIQMLEEWLDQNKYDRFNSLALDSITHVQRVALTELTGGDIPPGDVPPQSQIQHWGRVLAVVTNIADKFFGKLPVHMMMTALTRRDEIASLGLTMFAPFLWGQSGLEVPSHAELVGRLMAMSTIPTREQKQITDAVTKRGADEPFNILYTEGGRDYIAKWQGVADPPPAIIAPTVGKLIAILKRG